MSRRASWSVKTLDANASQQKHEYASSLFEDPYDAGSMTFPIIRSSKELLISPEQAARSSGANRSHARGSRAKPSPGIRGFLADTGSIAKDLAAGA